MPFSGIQWKVEQKSMRIFPNWFVLLSFDFLKLSPQRERERRERGREGGSERRERGREAGNTRSFLHEPEGGH